MNLPPVNLHGAKNPSRISKKKQVSNFCHLMDTVPSEYIIYFVGFPVIHSDPDLNTIDLLGSQQLNRKSFLVFQKFCLGLPV